MQRCLHYFRLFPGTEERFDQMHAELLPEVATNMHEAGLSNVTVFRRGTDAWRYAEAEPDRETAYRRYLEAPASRERRHALRDVLADLEAPDGGLIWYDEVFHTDAPRPAGPFERGCFSLVIDTDRAELYDRLHAEPWPEMIEAIAEAGYRDYSGFRRGAHVVYVGDYYPDFDTVIARINATDVAARWGRALDGVITTFTDGAGRNLTAHEVYHVD
jgi:L-rhamnose mutarotase